jgi:hypothetical protein
LTVTPATTGPTPINPVALGYIAHMAEGNSWKTALTIVNLLDTQQRLTVKFGAEGRGAASLPVPIAGVGTFPGVYFDLAGNGSGILETAGTSANLATGWISIEGPANGFGAMAVFRSVNSGRPDARPPVPCDST